MRVMRVLVPILIALLGLAAFYGTYLVGRIDGRRNPGLTRGSARRYKQAVQILDRIDTQTDYPGLAGALTDETRQQIHAWLVDHRKEFPTV